MLDTPKKISAKERILEIRAEPKTNPCARLEPAPEFERESKRAEVRRPGRGRICPSKQRQVEEKSEKLHARCERLSILASEQTGPAPGYEAGARAPEMKSRRGVGCPRR